MLLYKTHFLIVPVRKCPLTALLALKPDAEFHSFLSGVEHARGRQDPVPRGRRQRGWKAGRQRVLVVQSSRRRSEDVSSRFIAHHIFPHKRDDDEVKFLALQNICKSLI